MQASAADHREHTPPTTTTSIPDDAAFRRHVLVLPDGQTEAQVDHDLKERARALGVDVDAMAIPQEMKGSKEVPSPPVPTDTPRRSQESVASRMSQSTGYQSIYSDASRENCYSGVPSRRSRASISLRDYDAFLARGRVRGRQSFSFSPPSTPSQSTFSLPLTSPASSPKRPFRGLRGLSMLRLSRNASTSSLVDACQHCPHDVQSQRRAVHQLPCGHRLCTQALRNTIKTATGDRVGAIPRCCGLPTSGRLVEHVMTRAEQNALLDKSERWDDAASATVSWAGGSRPPSVASRPPGALTAGSRTVSDGSKADSIASKQLVPELDPLCEREDLKQLHHEQLQQRERFWTYITQQRSLLVAQHGRVRDELHQKHERAMEELIDAHAAALIDAEDKQVQAEADLRILHDQEKLSNATALKHMEAYCAGTYASTDEPHGRPVTDQDRAELEKTRKLRDQMDAKHESQINVLRGEQSRRMRSRQQRQEREILERKKAQKRGDVEVERSFGVELQNLEDWVDARRDGLRSRWRLQTAILTKETDVDSSAVKPRVPCGLAHSAGEPPPETTDANRDVHAAAGADTSDEGTDPTSPVSTKSGISTGFAWREVATSEP